MLLTLVSILALVTFAMSVTFICVIENEHTPHIIKLLSTGLCLISAVVGCVCLMFIYDV